MTVILLVVGLYLALFASPVDYQQGHTVRIMVTGEDGLSVKER